MKGMGRRHGRIALAATALTLPGVHVQAPLPAVPKLPGVQTPTVPDVRVPSVPSAPRLRSTPSLHSVAGPSTGGSAPSAGAAPAAASPAAPAAQSAPGSTASPTAPAPAQARSSGRASGTRSSSRERSFRHTARRLEPCLFALSGFDRRVIVLRAGYGGRRALSRGRVARRLHTSVRRVRGAERRALSELRTTSRTRGCLGGAGSGGIVLAAVVDSAAAHPLIAAGPRGDARLVVAAARAGSGGSDRATVDTGAVLSAHAAAGSGPAQEAVVRAAAEASGSPPLVAMLGLFALVALLVAGAMALLLRRRAATPAPVAGSPPPVAAPAPPMAAPPPPVEPPPPEPIAQSPEPNQAPARPQPPPAARRVSNRTALSVAASMASLAAGYLVRRRRR